ncbi:unnamed protein product [Rotaria socialis]|uniref:Ig-like domain-containing protein n=1 Tax=Rotaria socialis TaxID=392032 RepID=A0A818GJA6_9BILA|nr:unnamed protein product [Rotaria socialis]CAF3479413.1 unnamed protein product [Rotaria socialis]CAF3491001.1 unnamed protein product [Rotaria socialis]CAF3676351.1 unnamed protein product [Rotaria socialis]CAF3713034.1 unnamed protein product [Rotaria socialis]
MIFFNCFGLILIVHARYILGNVCHECNGMTFNSIITVDNLPSPIGEECEIVPSEYGCSARVTWFDDGTSEVHYIADPNFPLESVITQTERKVTTWSGEYITNKYISFNCQASNNTPCNTAENLKRALISTTWSTNEQIEKFDTLIVPTTDFYGSTCLQLLNKSNCPITNLLSCQQCMGIIEYSNTKSVCAMCPSGKALTNSYEHETIFFLQNKTQVDKITLACRRRGACNSIENIDRIKNELDIKFDFEKFYRSTASITKSPMMILFLVVIVGVFSCCL